VAGLVWVSAQEGLGSAGMAWFGAVVVVCAGLLMVSNFKYYSFKNIDIKGRVPFVALLAIVIVFSVIFIDPARILFGLAFIYALSGPVMFVMGKRFN